MRECDFCGNPPPTKPKSKTGLLIQRNRETGEELAMCFYCFERKVDEFKQKKLHRKLAKLEVVHSR